MFECLTTRSRDASGAGTYCFVRPLHCLGLELRAVPHLQRAGRAAGEELGDLLPGEGFVLLEVHEERVVLGREFELGAARLGRRGRHAGLADDAGGRLGHHAVVGVVVSRHFGRTPGVG